MGIDQDINPIFDIKFWRLKLGLLPVPLYKNELDSKQFVLLNGTNGNFCLDLLEQLPAIENRSRAWSSDVSYYLTLDEKSKNLIVQNWSRPNTQEVSINKVLSDLNGFHRHLESTEPKSQQNIVKHVIRVFRSLRNQMGNEVDGTATLKVFLGLLASATESKPLSDIDFNRWGLSAETKDFAGNLSSNIWESFISDLKDENINNLRPNLALTLRHVSGRVFQEAHYEAVFISSAQLSFVGFSPAPIKIHPKTSGIGLHFTPPALARTLVEEALLSYGKSDKPYIKIFDPACGSGEFLREILRQLLLKNYKGKIHLIGWDISTAACDMARFVLSLESREQEDLIEFDIQCRDSLSLESAWANDVDILIMNPPFVSWQHMSAEQKDNVKNVLDTLVKERPDLSSAFIWKASQCLSKDGVLASIVPASFLDSNSNEPIRQQLNDILEIKLVARLGSHLLFSSALVDAALYVGAKSKTDVHPLAFWADHRRSSNSEGLRILRKVRQSDKDELPIVEDGFSIYSFEPLLQNSKSWAPRPFGSYELLTAIRNQVFPTVEHLFDVKQGVRTGNIKAFLLSDVEYNQLPKVEQKYFRPAVVNKSIKLGYLIDSTYIFYPYGKFEIETEEKLENVVNFYYENILLKYKDKLTKRAGIDPNKWWNLTRHRDWQITPSPKILSTYFGDSGSFAWDESGKFIVVQGFGWMLKGSKNNSMPLRVSLAYLAILNSQLFGELLAAISNHVGGGQWNLSKKFVKDIPLPDLTQQNINPQLIEELAKYGEQIHSGAFTEEDELDKLVKTIYRVS